MMTRHSRQQGFTLLEMVIVLTIIALVSGMFMVGRSMTRAADINSITSDLTKWTRAAVAFRDKYEGLPGDLYNATTFWTADSCPGTYSTSKSKFTCNGDGNGHITDYFLGEDYNEMFRAWQHLANAGMVEGSFTGRYGQFDQRQTVPELNVMGSKVRNAGYTLLYFDHPCDDTNYWPSVYRHVFTFGTPFQGSITVGPALSSAEVMALDQKIDDGLPAHGNVMVAKANIMTGCTTSDDATTSRYTGTTAQTCGIIYKTGF